MEDRFEHNSKQVSRKITQDGVTLTIIARQIVEGEWELAVQNQYGINSHWYEFFSTAQQAIAAGARAIEEEGAAAFMDIQGFEYLFE